MARALLVLLAVIWCIAAIKPLFCSQALPECGTGANGCWISNIYLSMGGGHLFGFHSRGYLFEWSVARLFDPGMYSRFLFSGHDVLYFHYR